MNRRRIFSLILFCLLVFFSLIINSGLTNAAGQKSFPATPFDPGDFQKLSRDSFNPPSHPTRVSFHKTLVTSVDYTSALAKGSNHLIGLQSDITEDNAGNGSPDIDLEDGGWDWQIDSTINAHSGSSSPENTYGVTADGVLGTYLTLGGKAYPPSLSTRTSIEDTYSGMLANLNIDSGGDFPFLVRLSVKTGDNKYANLARARYDAKIAFYGGSKALANAIVTARGVNGDGIIPWDINQFAVGAAKLNDYFPGQGYDADADTFAQVIYEDMYNNNPGYFDETNKSEWWWTLGIAGALEAFTVSGTHLTQRDQLATTLLSYQNDGIAKTPKGAWDWNDDYPGGDYQTTAYAIMALMAYGGAQAKSACIEGVNWLVGDQRANGGWYWDDWWEYTEEEGEVLWAISLLVPNEVWVDDDYNSSTSGWGYDHFDKIQKGVDAVTSTGIVHVYSGNYTEQLVIQNDLLLEGMSSSPKPKIIAPAVRAPAFQIAESGRWWDPVIFMGQKSGEGISSISIKGFEIDGQNLGTAGSTFVALLARNVNSGTFRDCDVQNFHNPANSDRGSGLMVYGNSNMTVRNNTVSAFSKNGITANGDFGIAPDPVVSIDSNIVIGDGFISAVAQNGIQVGFGAGGVVNANQISDIGWIWNGSGTQWVSCGILPAMLNTPGPSVNCSGNVLTNVQVGIYYSDGTGNASGNRYHMINSVGLGPNLYFSGILACDPLPTAPIPKSSPLSDKSAVEVQGTSALAKVALVLNFDISNNTVIGDGKTASEGIYFYNWSGGSHTLVGTATNNTVKGFGSGLISHSDGSTVNVTFQDNLIECNQVVGIYLAGGTTGSSVYNNRLIGNVQNAQDDGVGPNSWDNGSAGNFWDDWASNSGFPTRYDIPGTAGSIDHFPQAPTVVWVDDSWAGTPCGDSVGGHLFGYDALVKIQEGVNRVSSAGIVNVLGGIYNENIVIPKPLSLLGAGRDLVKVYPAISDIGLPDPQQPPSFRGSQMCVVKAKNVTIDGLTFDGDSPTLTPTGTIDVRNGIITEYATGDWSNLKVQNCTVKNIYLRGIYASAQTPNNLTGVDFNHNIVSNVKGWSMQSAGIMLWGSSGTVSQNQVSNTSLGVFYHMYSDGTIMWNTATNSEVCLGVNSNDSPISISYNRVNNSSQGIQTVASLSQVDVKFNSITSCSTGVALYGGGSGQVNLWDDTIKGLNVYATYGVWASTNLDPWGLGELHATLKRNIIKDNFYGILLNELASDRSQILSVSIGGSMGDRNFIYNNLGYELLMEYCNDDQIGTYNYWGKSTYAQIEDEIFHKVDQADLGLVSFNPGILHGDVNLDGQLSVADVVYLINYLFKGGPAPELPIIADINRDGNITVSDAVYMINYLFKGGPVPKIIASESAETGAGKVAIDKSKLSKPVNLHSVEK